MGKVVNKIVRIEKRLFPKHESLAKSFETELEKNSSLLYSLIEDWVAGYVMYSWPSSLRASITKLPVKEKYRKQGLGEALFKVAIEPCRTGNVQRISLHVDHSRLAAISLYNKLGFEVDC